MASLQDHLKRLREERVAREKARIVKLREINLKKYNRDELQSTTSKASCLNKSVKNVSKNVTKARENIKNKPVPSKQVTQVQAEMNVELHTKKRALQNTYTKAIKKTDGATFKKRGAVTSFKTDRQTSEDLKTVQPVVRQENEDIVLEKQLINDETNKVNNRISSVNTDRKIDPSIAPSDSEELQAQLKCWLFEHHKSIGNYQHLLYFGNHIQRQARQGKARTKPKRPSPPKYNIYVSENKEHCAVEAELMHGVLNDLTRLLREGFEWPKCARWLRSVRDHFPAATRSPAYWECRSVLEGCRGDLFAAMLCWEEAVKMGTVGSTVEANLDHLLNKFMLLTDSTGEEAKDLNPKMVDVKNVLKKLIMRSALQLAKLRSSNQNRLSEVAVTPVYRRRSSRLSVYGSEPRGHDTTHITSSTPPNGNFTTPNTLNRSSTPPNGPSTPLSGFSTLPNESSTTPNRPSTPLSGFSTLPNESSTIPNTPSTPLSGFSTLPNESSTFPNRPSTPLSGF